MAETAKQKSRREKRIKRKKTRALAHVEQFEDTLSDHELVKARLEAMPENLRDDGWGEAIAEQEKQIDQLKVYIETTIAEADKIADPPES